MHEKAGASRLFSIQITAGRCKPAFFNPDNSRPVQAGFFSIQAAAGRRKPAFFMFRFCSLPCLQG
ncbi:hypothetical protein, partial [Rhodanobacter thiooxydans]|uniref:hypothetical protein n=1 Tax=Rhodanobacter thiooxydans TaxID=416169 RepID=UPI001EE63A8E